MSGTSTHYPNWVKKIGRYVVLPVTIGAFLFAHHKSQPTESHDNAGKIVQLAHPELEKKISYIINHMQQTQEHLVSTTQGKEPVWHPKTCNLKEKQPIQDYLLRLAADKRGKLLLSVLDVTQINFVALLQPLDIEEIRQEQIKQKIVQNTVHHRDIKAAFFPDSKTLFVDFKHAEMSDIVRELLHAALEQANSCAKYKDLHDLNGVFDRIQWTNKMIEQGFFSKENLSKECQKLLFNYQKYEHNNLDFALHYLLPDLVWHRNSKTVTNFPKTPSDLSRYAKRLGLSNQEAKKFARELANGELKGVFYGIDREGNELVFTKKGHISDPPLKGSYNIENKDTRKISTAENKAETSQIILAEVTSSLNQTLKKGSNTRPQAFQKKWRQVRR